MRVKFSGRNPFQIREARAGQEIEVWMGKPAHPESELVLRIDRTWLPSLIATLRAAENSP